MMKMKNTMTKKILTRLKLIQWHYFDNETINFSSSNLFSGENGSGKSTIIDAIQLVLTTDTRHFNNAANAYSKRDVKSYVRGKTGEEGITAYKRNGNVISYIALEIYEENKNRYFVIGVKIDSVDLESEPKKKWFCEECTLDDLTFIVENKPARDEQFKNNGKKVNYIYQSSAAQERFKHRMGNLQDTFYDLLMKSIAFKPMKDVRSFVSQFVLPEKEIDIGNLRENINALKSMQDMFAEVKRQISALELILADNTKLNETQRQMLIIDMLLKLAELKGIQQNIIASRRNLEILKSDLRTYKSRSENIDSELERKRNEQTQILVAINTNESTKLIQKYESELQRLDGEIRFVKKDFDDFQNQMSKIKNSLKAVPEIQSKLESNMLSVLADENADDTQKNAIVCDVKKIFENCSENLRIKNANSGNQIDILKNENAKLSKQISDLKQYDRLNYDTNTVKLKNAIESEFGKRGISSPVRIFADLLDITDTKWQNAIEGYLNTQRFHIIVEPQYYDIAAQVYDKNKKNIHTAALVNTNALDMSLTVPQNSLAQFITSKNRYALAYANYLLGRVTACENINELKQNNIAVTKDCMLYQGKALRKINPTIYSMPFIGKYARQKQLEMMEKELEGKYTLQRQLSAETEILKRKINSLSECNFDTLSSCISAQRIFKELQAQRTELQKSLKDARNDPTILKLQTQSEKLQKKISELENSRKSAESKIAECEIRMNDTDKNIISLQKDEKISVTELEKLCTGHESEFAEAEEKYNKNEKTKSADTIRANYMNRRTALNNTFNQQIYHLSLLQSKYKDGELGTGKDYIKDYLAEYEKLTKNNLIEYEEKLKVMQENCETEFRETFLDRMRENIKNAKDLFRNLNKTLSDISYGGDRYQFTSSPSVSKKHLYEMITSEFNVGGLSLFSHQLEEKYHDEMQELFSKLTVSNENGDDILREYTDYRNYMDYDIEVISQNGKKQKFSNIHREKSGGETQTPYYVAIAASFSQIYNYGESIRIIILDEAFDKMDEERIKSMMQFFKELNFQVILAAPSSRLEIIGECTDQILMVYKEDYSSIVEEFSL